MTAVIRRSLLQGLCGVGVVAALSLASAAQEPVELTMISHEATPVVTVTDRTPR